MPVFLEVLLSNIGDSLFYLSHLASNFKYIGLTTFFILIFLAFNGVRAIFYVPILAFYFAQFELGQIFWNSFFIICATFSVPILRKNLLSNLIISLIEKLGLLPKISQTEKIALTSGNIWIDGELFSGKPNFKNVFSQKYSKLTDEEKSFIENEVEEVCKMCVDYDVQTLRDLPENVWQFLKEKKFFGMIISKEYGGLGFSALAHSCVIEKLSSRSVPLAITVMVPNSLGPAELLLHYGTKDQQDYYLPRLADGREIPCFALTETVAGSDATSIISNGVLFKDENGEIKIRLNWKKRYITLGAVATVIGVAFQLRDPEKLLSENEDVGITCALIPNNTKGVRQGRRHDPLATPFINSPLNGENVIVGLDSVIGGKVNLGKGWKMLMESLAAGRGISLPSTSSGGAKFVARATSAYAALRQQFGASIAKFEGIEEVLARIASKTYTADALRVYTASAVDLGMKPAVITAIAKYHSTEMFRQVVNDGMDVMAGRAIIRGPRNLLANAYFSAPISITVEGANILTRSLIHFGQGAIMCHPFVYQEIEALENGDVEKFDNAFFSHIKHLIRNTVRSMVLSLTRGHLSCNNYSKNKIVKKYSKKIAWASATFAMLADIAIAMFGGNLKRKEKLNGRFGDVLSALYLSVCILKKFEENGCKKSDEAVVEYAVKDCLIMAQKAFDGIYQNMFNSVLKILFLPFTFFAKFNSLSCPPNDELQHKIVKDFVKNCEFRDDISSGIFVSFDKEDNLGRLENALKLYESSQEIVAKIKEGLRKNQLPKKRIEDLLEIAQEKSIISIAEKQKLQEVFALIIDAMEVDEYSLEEYKNI